MAGKRGLGFRAGAELLPVHAVEVGIIVKAGIAACFQQGLPALVQLMGQQKPFVVDILVYGITGNGFKYPAQMVFIDIEGLGQVIQGKLLCQMAVNIDQKVLYPLIRYPGQGQRLLYVIEKIQKLGQHTFGNAFRAVLEITVGFHEKMVHLLIDDAGRDLAAHPQRALREKAFQLRAAVLMKEVQADKNNNPFVFIGSQKHIMMHFIGPGDKNIMGVGLVNIPFDMKFGIPGKKQIYFVQVIVVMEPEFRIISGRVVNRIYKIVARSGM